MKRGGRFTTFSVFLACSATLIASIWPGWLNDLLGDLVLMGFLFAPVILIAIGVCIYLLRHLRYPIAEAFPWKYLVISSLIIFVTLAALGFHIPRRMAFASCRSSFQRLVDQGVQDHRRFNQRIGPYYIDECLIDERGGAYFRVYSGYDGIGPDVMSYGFCYQPNQQGSPFGAARYRTFSLGNGWHWFRASDDWF